MTRRRHALVLALVATGILGLHLAVLSAWTEAPVLRPAGPAPQVRWVAATRADAPATATAAAPTTRPETAPVPGRQAVAAAPAQARSASAPAPTQAPAASAASAAAPALASSSSSAAPAAAAATSTGPVRVPPPMRLRYAVTAQTRGLTLGGEATLEWRPEGAAYQADLAMRLRPVGSRTQHSEGQLTAQGLVPLKFIDRTRHEEAAHFDPAGGRIVFSANSPQAVLIPGAQDRLSLVMQLAALVAGQPERFRAGTRLEIQTATTRDADLWHLRVEGEQALQLPGGTVQALRLVREPRQPYDSVLEIWLAPGQHYAPVRLRLTQPGGDWVDQAWVGTDRP